jgi:hypothetical protein
MDRPRKRRGRIRILGGKARPALPYARGPVFRALLLIFLALGALPVCGQTSPVDAISRSLTAYASRIPDPPPTDAFSGEFTLYNVRVPNPPTTDAYSREFNVYNISASRPVPVDAISRESTVWNIRPVAVPESQGRIPEKLVVLKPRPNPTSGTVIFAFGLPNQSAVSLAVFDASGRTVSVLLSREQRAAGWHRVMIDGSGWNNGVYFYRFDTGTRSFRGKLVIRR